MADDRTKKPDANEPMSALERYLAKQKQEKAAQAVRENAAKPKSRLGLSGAGLGDRSSRGAGKSAQKPPQDARGKVTYGPGERPSLAGIERPAADPSRVETPQPPSLSRWESVAESRLSENEQRARDAGAPAAPPSWPPPDQSNQASTFHGGAMGAGAGGAAADVVHPITDRPLPTDAAVNADFGPRLIAAFVDACIVGSLSWFARKIAFALAAMAFGSIVEIHVDGIGYLVSLCVTYAYYGYFYPVKGASPGKMMLGLEVVDTDGVTRLTPWRAFFREAIGKVISAIPFFMGYIIVLIRSDRRALHDLLFDTRVIKKGLP
jgi:uncharacterized RDD family membrane protein YckC